MTVSPFGCGLVSRWDIVLPGFHTLAQQKPGANLLCWHLPAVSCFVLDNPAGSSPRESDWQCLGVPYLSMRQNNPKCANNSGTDGNFYPAQHDSIPHPRYDLTDN